MTRIISLFVAAIFLAVSFAAVASPIEAEAKTTTRHGIAISDKGGVAVKCKKGKRMPATVNRCPKKGWVAYMGISQEWKFYKSKKKAIKASERAKREYHFEGGMSDVVTR